MSWKTVLDWLGSTGEKNIFREGRALLPIPFAEMHLFALFSWLLSKASLLSQVKPEKGIAGLRSKSMNYFSMQETRNMLNVSSKLRSV